MYPNLKIPERIDTILNILQYIPRLQGFDQWNPVCEAMKQLADLSRDVQEAEKAENGKEAGSDPK